VVAVQLHPCHHARTQPDKPALIMGGSGEVVTYAQLDERSNRAAQLWRSLGLQRGEVIAVCLENSPRYLEIYWSAQRSGLYLVCISTHLSVAEVGYILQDSGARALITSPALWPLAEQLAAQGLPAHAYIIGAARGAYASWEQALVAQPAEPIADQSTGADMLYSSGTTGRPKGIKPELPTYPIDEISVLSGLLQKLYGIHAGDVYLSPAPLYHAAPLRWCVSIQQLGGTAVIMEHFDAETALQLIERHRITCSQWVPTHFVRLLRLPPETRQRYDLASLRVAVHAAAPCPIPVKQQMMQWWGPIVYEYYAGTEGNGMTMITPAEWLARPGSVGKAVYGVLHICDADSNEVPPLTEGTVYFSGARPFEYHNAEAKTLESRNQHGWSTIGDVGYVDADGYLFLTDRKAFMIISGGVNIYPQELENLLITHPKVLDAAVIGIPDEEMGEKVAAVVQPVDMSQAGPELAAELLAFARQHISHIKAPRLIDFVAQLPRHPNGKLYKRLLVEAYRVKK
jgi:long-chain acyl-CoA synthetase